MAFSLNKVMLIGNMGKDAETRVTPSNLSVTSFSVATTNSYKGKDGNWVNDTNWHNIVSFNLSDYFKEVLKKGAKVYIEGRIQTRDYNDKEGNKRYITEIITDKIIPLDSRGESSSSSSSQKSEGESIAPEGDAEDLPF
ncbi:MAG: single-stranded DNA-binding protein [Ignavibacteriaceae bacterium]|jgi:single-strand DNA-binding protein|nr:single-stranded DNA-binding protein [Ignavibacteriaceae bacterium]